jgi:hypothetical protein
VRGVPNFQFCYYADAAADSVEKEVADEEPCGEALAANLIMTETSFGRGQNKSLFRNFVILLPTK